MHIVAPRFPRIALTYKDDPKVSDISIHVILFHIFVNKPIHLFPFKTGISFIRPLSGITSVHVFYDKIFP